MKISLSRKVGMKAYFYPDVFTPLYPKRYYAVLGRGPRQVKNILEDLDTSCNASLQHSLLELLGVVMKTTQRVTLGLEPSYPWKYRKRNPVHVSFYRKERKMIRGWYRANREGRREHVDALFQVISQDPAAFLQMVAP